MKMPSTMPLEEDISNVANDIEDLEQEPTEFPCGVCSAKFVTRMSLIRHMILHEDDEEKDLNEGHQSEESQSSTSSSSQAALPHIPEQNLLEAILKNGSKSVPINGVNGVSNGLPGGVVNGEGNRASAKRPIPNLKPLPSLIQIQEHQPQDKNLQCHLCGVWFRKKEDLSRHVTRTHGSAKFTCPYCHRNISRRDHLKRHIKNVHPEFCTATEVGPFVNQGAGRPPKQPREVFGNGMEEEQPPAKRPKLMNGHESNGATSNVQDAPILQHFLTEIPNQIRFINESRIETDSESDDPNEDESMLTESQLYDPPQQTADQYDDDEDQYQDENDSHIANEYELFNNDENENEGEFVNESNGAMIIKNDEADCGERETEPEEEEEEPDEDLDDDRPLMSGVDLSIRGMLREDTNSSSYSENEDEMENQDENGNGISDYDEESILKPLLVEGEGASGSTERKFKCELCDAAFMSKLNMHRHMSTHSVARPHKCSVCGKGFLRKEHLTKHLSSVHSGLKYRCQFCRKDISRKDHLLRHIRNCHPQEFLGMSLDMIESVPQICQVPAATFSDNPNMRVAALSCDMCSEIFNHIDELMEHQSDAHSDIRKFKCEECFKSFKRKEHLIKHLSTHAPATPKSYSCSECNETFPSLAIAHAHLRQVHGQQKNANHVNTKMSSPPPTTSSLPCNLCDNTFQQRAHLLQHLKAYHGVANPERRFTDASFNPVVNNVSPAPRQMISTPKSQSILKQFHQRSYGQRNSFDKPQIRSLLGIHAANRKDEGSLGSLMGLINKGSISLSLSKIGQ